MKISRDAASKLHYILDQWIPPVIRDSRWFMAIPFKFLFKDKAKIFSTFKDKAHSMDVNAYRQVYEDVSKVIIERETDLNQKCIESILQSICGKTILEAGCGRAFLSNKLSEKYKVTAADIAIDQKLSKKYPSITFKNADVENLPFKDQSFDTVVCTHTLEHVQNFSKAVSELRRVTRKRLIVVVPRQRPYKYTFDLHLHFFPYKHSLIGMMGKQKNQECRELDGDWFYIEDKNE